MAKFQYTVINRENKQLSGAITATDETAARKELNNLGFSILQIQQVSDENTTSEAAGQKFEFSAIDKDGKKIIGTIQAADRFEAYKRLLKEYSFQVDNIYPSGLPETEKAKWLLKGVAELTDRLKEESMLSEATQQQQQQDVQEISEKQERLKSQVDFVLKKVNEIIDQYRDELQPPAKEKIKYYVEKILRIKNSTNLDYIRETCTEMLKFLQEEEIFLHEEARRKEKNELAVEAKSMLLKIEQSQKKKAVSVFDQMREWRKNHIYDNPAPVFSEKFLDEIFSIFIGPSQVDAEIEELRNKLNLNKEQLKEFFKLYFSSKVPEFKQEVKKGGLKLWNERGKLKKQLHNKLEEIRKNKLATNELSSLEKVENTLMQVSGFALLIYIAYYFLAIYATSKQIDIPYFKKFELIFHSVVLKYFFSTLFIFHSLIAIKHYFFFRKPHINFFFLPCFILLSTLIVLNF